MFLCLVVLTASATALNSVFVYPLLSLWPLLYAVSTPALNTGFFSVICVIVGSPEERRMQGGKSVALSLEVSSLWTALVALWLERVYYAQSPGFGAPAPQKPWHTSLILDRSGEGQKFKVKTKRSRAYTQSGILRLRGKIEGTRSVCRVTECSWKLVTYRNYLDSL